MRIPDELSVQTIGKYQVEKVLGRGGMGTVYLAHDPVEDRKVALKTMAPGVAETPELKARFLREALAAGGLNHRHIVAVYELDEDRGQPFIAMEYVEGTDLEALIRRHEPLSVEWRLDVLRQVCEGLAHAHRSGIVHRDVKPANIRVTPEGEVKIMDFGIAHLQSSKLTHGALVLGTIHYMAPEQVEERAVDHRADVFSVGTIAYELLAYRKPFDGESATSVMYQIVHERPDMSALPPTAYSPGLERIVEKALAKRPSERYQDLEQMRDDLERLVRETAARIIPPAEEGPASDPASLRAAIEQARTAGHLQKALTLCRLARQRDPEDTEAPRLQAEVEAAIREKEVEQLSGMALGYAADGDLEFAMRIAGKVGRLAPESPRYRELVASLEAMSPGTPGTESPAQAARRKADAAALATAALDHFVHNDHARARASVEKALALEPANRKAQELLKILGSLG